MVSNAARGLKLLYLPKTGPFDSELGSRVPEAYKKFYFEWKLKKPEAVHHIPPTQKIDADPHTGEIKILQDKPIPVQYPPEHNDGLWGGEGVIRGFQKRHPLRRRVPHFWVPTLKKSIVYSEILDKYMEVTVTERLLRLIHANYGFDHYILKTPACDLKSTLALQIKRKMLLTLSDNTSIYPTNPEKQQEVYDKYKKYLEQYNKEEIEWYGLTLPEALKKQRQLENQNKESAVLKSKYRLDLLQKLKEANIAEANDGSKEDDTDMKKSWLNKINLFSKDGKSSTPKTTS